MSIAWPRFLPSAPRRRKNKSSGDFETLDFVRIWVVRMRFVWRPSVETKGKLAVGMVCCHFLLLILSRFFPSVKIVFSKPFLFTLTWLCHPTATYLGSYIGRQHVGWLVGKRVDQCACR
jgi:hypothetical protein